MSHAYSNTNRKDNDIHDEEREENEDKPSVIDKVKGRVAKALEYKPPPLHRAVAEEHRDGVLIEKLTNKRSTKKVDNFDRTPLHVACGHGADWLTIQNLYNANPNSVATPDKVGRLPIHLACSSRCDLNAIRFLLDHDPDSILETTDRGATPLLCAVEGNASLEVVQYLIEQDPQIMTLSHYKLGKTPVHAAAARGQTLDVIRLLQSKRPHSVEEKDSWGKTPLACACSDRNVREEVLDFFLDPLAVQTTDRGGQLPFHIAVANSLPTDLLEILLDEHPQAVSTTDNNGRYPFHSACTNPRIQIETIHYLERAYPEALKSFDKLGCLPLHLAIQRKLPTDIILYLMETCEGAVRSREATSKQYPLQIAVRSGADFSVIKRTIDIYPAAIDSTDKDENSLIHVACSYRQNNVELMNLILDHSDPIAITSINNDGMLPLHLACQHRAPWSVLKLLIDQYPEGLVTKDKKGNVPLHKAFQTVTAMPILVRLAQSNHHTLYKLNKKKKTPLDFASLETEKNFKRASQFYNLRKAYCPICIRDKGLD